MADQILSDADKHSVEYNNGYEIIPSFLPEVIGAMKYCGKALQEASQMAFDVEWFMSGDDGEQTFLEKAKKWKL